MTETELQTECELGQAQLMRMEYLEAEVTLAGAERRAWAARDWDSLSRLYMPLQEARRQRRRRCGEGTVRLDLISDGPGDVMEAMHVLKNYSHGQLLVAGWGSIEPAVRLRKLAAEHQLYVDTFLAAAYPTEQGRVVAIMPLEGAALPDPTPWTQDELVRQLPAHSLIFREGELPSGGRRGTYQTFGEVMDHWERLHAPFLAAADAQIDPILKMEGYRTAIRVDYACELAHQKLSDVARRMMQEQGAKS